MKLKLVMISIMMALLSSCDIGERIWLMHEICTYEPPSDDREAGSTLKNDFEPGLFGTLNTTPRSSDDDSCVEDPLDAMCIIPGDNDAQISNESGLPICSDEDMQSGMGCNDSGSNCPLKGCKLNSHDSKHIYCPNGVKIPIENGDMTPIPGPAIR